MKFTPLDIQRREFERTFRGLNEGEVRAFLHEVASEWEEVQVENQRFKEEVLDLRERLRQYQEQERIFRETLLQAQRTKEDLLESAGREKELMLREARFQADEIIRDAQHQVVALEVQLRNLKMERARVVQTIESLLDRMRRQLLDEIAEPHTPSSPTVNLESLSIDEQEHLEDEPPRPRRRHPKA